MQARNFGEEFTVTLTMHQVLRTIFQC